MIAPFRFGSFHFHSSQHALRLSQQVIHPWHAQAPKPVGLVSSAKEEKHRNTSKNQSEMDNWKQQNKNDIRWLLRTQSHKYPTSACSLCISFHSIAAKVDKSWILEFSTRRYLHRSGRNGSGRQGSHHRCQPWPKDPREAPTPESSKLVQEAQKWQDEAPHRW